MDYLKDEIIENYIDGMLSDSEKQAFEKALKTNKLLQKALHRKQETIQIIQEMGDIHLSDRIKKIVQEEMAAIKLIRPKVARRRWLYGAFAVAASVLILIMVYMAFTPTTNELLFEKYYQASILLERNERSDMGEANFKQAYQSENYRDALQYSETLENSLKTENSEIVFMIGICHLELDNYEKAVEQFDSLIKNFTNEKSKGLWYKGLTYLKMNDTSKSKQTFEQLLKEDTDYRQQEAKDILEVLKNN